MFKNLADQSFQRKFEKFKENWVKEGGSRTSERLVFTEVTIENETPCIAKLKIESSTGKRGRSRNTIKPGGIFKKNDVSSVRNNSAKKPRGVARRLFSDPPKVNALGRISDVAKKTTNSEPASRPKRKCTSTRNERREKLLKRNVEEGSESSSESSILISNSRNSIISNYAMPQRNDIRYDYDFANNENIPSASVRPSSFHLRSPKLLLNGDEPNNSNQSSDSLAAVLTENDIEMESSEVTLSDVSTSISARRVGLESRSVVREDPPKISDSLRNDCPSTSNNLIYSSIKMQENKILSWLLPPNNISESDTTTFSDDGMSSVECCPICSETSLGLYSNCNLVNGLLLLNQLI